MYWNKDQTRRGSVLRRRESGEQATDKPTAVTCLYPLDSYEQVLRCNELLDAFRKSSDSEAVYVRGRSLGH